MESQGRDIKLDEKRVEGYRNFATKLWNAARFLQMNGIGASESLAAARGRATGQPLDHRRSRRDAGEARRCVRRIALRRNGRCHLSLRLGDLLRLVCGACQRAIDEETKRVAAWAFDQILAMLHPLMPFITEELWHAMGDRAPLRADCRQMARTAGPVDPQAKREIDWLIRLVSEVRAARSELGVPPGRDAYRRSSTSRANETRARLERNSPCAGPARAASSAAPSTAQPAAARRRSWSTRRPSSCRSKA